MSYPTSNSPGGGGGGYSNAVVSLTGGDQVTVVVGISGAGGAGAPDFGKAGGDTFLCNTLTTNCLGIGGSAVKVGAKGGRPPTGGDNNGGLGGQQPGNTGGAVVR